jgi:pilus assembly protein CpaF
MSSLSERVAAAKATESRVFTGARSDALQELRGRLHYKVVEELGPTLYDRQMSDAELRLRVLEMLEWALEQEQGLPLTAADKKSLLSEIANDVIGYGPIDPLLNDPDITEVMVNGPFDVWTEHSGKIKKTDIRFVDEVHLRRIIDKIVGQVGRRIDEATPMVDARLPDGSRVNAVIHPLAIGGPFLTIRKFAVDPYTEADLVRFGTFDQRSADFLRACVVGRLNVIISGGTGSGKTTTLNVLSSFCRVTSGSSRSRTPPSSSSTRTTCSASSPGRPTSRARARSPSATSSATPCACAPTGSWSGSAAAARPSTCSRR